MLTQAKKGADFHALHARDGAVVDPNPWDMGNGLSYLAHTLPFSEAALVLAGALPKEDHPHV